jgi:hypothetical protein
MSNGDKLFADLSNSEKEKARETVAQCSTHDTRSEPTPTALPIQEPMKPQQPSTASISIPRKRVEDLQKNYLIYFRHLVFLDPALIRMCEYDKNNRAEVRAQAEHDE